MVHIYTNIHINQMFVCVSIHVYEYVVCLSYVYVHMYMCIHILRIAKPSEKPKVTPRESASQPPTKGPVR